MRSVSVLLTIFLIVGLAQPADALIKRSKKDECTVCHVLWMDAFLTDEPTLLGPVQTNIVIAGSIGLSSSKRMCNSCHDGYVQDSRKVIDRGNRHHQLKKVPEWLELPKNFRLDINNEMYCGTCHGFHDIRGMGEIGSMPFMRLENDRSEMCMACHKDRAGKLGVANHPVNVRSDIIPAETVRRLGGKLGPDGEIICQSCHMPHRKSTLLAPFKESAICLICHGDKQTISESDHNLAVTFPKIKNARGQGVADTGPCGMCHLPHNGNSRWMWARKTGEGNPASQVCLSCHGREMGIRVTGRYSHPVGAVPGRSSVLPLFSGRGVMDTQGQVHCPSCHDVHKWNPGQAVRYTAKMEGGPADSFLRIANESSELCLACHGEKREIIGTDHDLRITAPDMKNIEGRRPPASGPCGACHVPHNAAGEKLWAREEFAGNPASGMCLACHAEAGEYINKTVGQFSHPTDVYLPQKGETAGLPLFTQAGRREAAGTVQCASCHDPHQWKPGALSPKNGKNTEGDTSNSFLRIAGNGESALCLYCHGDKKQVIDSDHNLLLTAPEEKNLQGAQPAASGPCSSCHIPHNAAGKNLWAKALTDGDDIVSQQCRSCHKKDGAAGNKRISRTSHPVDVPIAGIGGEIPGQFPLYSSEGERTKNGRVVCTTCHDPHTWSPGPVSSGETSGLPGNREGDSRSSFLRKANYPASDLCTACHAEQALVAGTPHDLNVSAPAEKNLAGETVKQTGPCGACHLVHNSPEDLKLWARPYGPVRKNENRMTALCTSCHSEGRVAGKKVQHIATHPEGIITTSEEGFIRLVYDDTGEKHKRGDGPSAERYTPILITNILGALRGREYTPLFNDRGKKVRTGKISCPSCHNVHRWSLDQREGEGDRERAEPPGSKFLRTESRNTVCVECHGEDALFRYLYFHSPGSRSWSAGK